MLFFAELPRDPDALLERLQADTEDRGRGKDHAVHTYAADVLRSGIVPADIRSSLFEVLNKLPTVEVTSQRVIYGIDVTVIGAKDIYAATSELIIDSARGQVVREISKWHERVGASGLDGTRTRHDLRVGDPSGHGARGRVDRTAERVNYQLRKIIKNRGQFSNDAAVVELQWLAIRNIDERARQRAKEAGRSEGQPRTAQPRLIEGSTIQGRTKVLNELALRYSERFPNNIIQNRPFTKTTWQVPDSK